MKTLLAHTKEINEQLARYGVKFGIYKDGTFNERLFPFDPVPRQIPEKDFAVDELGNIYQDDEVVSNIGIFDVEDYSSLREFANNMYVPEDGIIASDSSVLQGVLEGSNVNVVDEMVEMITVTRAYEANQKLIQTIDSDLERAVTQVGRVS